MGHGDLIMVQFSSTLVLAAYGFFLRSMALWWREDVAWHNTLVARRDRRCQQWGENGGAGDEDAGGYARETWAVAAVHVC